MRALFLSASFGGGHLHANLAVHEALGCEGLERDYLEYIPLWQRLPVAGLYQFSLRHWPGLYGWFYRFTNREREPRIITAQFDRAGFEAMRTDVLAFEPDVVVASFPTATALAGRVREAVPRPFANVLVVTDFRAHRHWAQTSADLILAPSAEAAADLERFGIPPAKIAVTGLPVRRVFQELPPAEAMRQKHGLDERPVVLIASGATEAYRAQEEAVQAVIALGRPAQVVRFRKNGERKQEDHGPVRVLSYPVGGLFPELFAAADFLLGKAGGLTVAEALVAGKPYLVYKPIPGHEEANARWLEQKGAGSYARSRRELTELLDSWLKDPGARAPLAERARALGRPDAARLAASRIRELVGVPA